MSRLIRTMALLVLVGGPFAAVTAQDISRDDMRSLDGQVQEIKSDVLGIASELDNLEERLLYPSNTQVALFVAIDDDDFRLDHQLTVSMIGKLKNGSEFNKTDQFSFAKGVEPKALGIMLAGPGLGKSGIQVGDW